MPRGLTRDTIAGMVATAVREVTKRNNHDQSHRERETARNKGFYADAERHAQPLLDGLSVVKDLSKGSFGFEVLSNIKDNLDQDNPDRVGIEVNIRLKGLGQYNRNPSGATPDNVDRAFSVTWDGKIYFCKKSISLE